MTTADESILVHIVTYGAALLVEQTIESVLAQQLPERLALSVEVTDNNVDGVVADRVEARFGPRIRVYRNRANLGFSAAHNQAAARFLSAGMSFFVVLNPDLRLETRALAELCAACCAPQALLATPLLLRARPDLQPLDPPIVDAAGMFVTSNLRHLDFGSGQPLAACVTEPRQVFGGTGACLCLNRSAVDRLLLCGEREADVDHLYPQLAPGRAERAQLFDEAFFAYREDAELAWRAQRLSIRCTYVPKAVGYHVRAVVPENRRSLPPEVNRWSVRNRFLMLLTHFRLNGMWHTVLPGLLWRNIAVIVGVLLLEQKSIGAFADLWRLLPRQIERRRLMAQRQSAAQRDVGAWFGLDAG